jgi:hypothetical protein
LGSLAGDEENPIGIKMRKKKRKMVDYLEARFKRENKV